MAVNENLRKAGRELKSIAVVSGKIGCAFNAVVAQGIERHAERIGMKRKSIVYHSARDGSDQACTRELLDVLKDDSIDAVIAVSFTPEREHMPALLKHKTPVVFLERHIKGFHGIKVDNYNGGRLAAEYLIEKGYKKPGVIVDKQSRDKNSASYERLYGFKDALAESKIKPVKDAVHTIENGRNTFEQMQGKLKHIDSIFSVAGDLVAIGFMIEAKANGIRFPKDLAIIGFDGMETAGIVDPPLTTISQPIGLMGQEAVDHIRSLILRPVKGYKHINIKTELIRGGSA